ncbi:MAG: hypothetical protein AAF903_12375 [Pseudomonadota bacterium]
MAKWAKPGVKCVLRRTAKAAWVNQNNEPVPGPIHCEVYTINSIELWWSSAFLRLNEFDGFCYFASRFEPLTDRLSVFHGFRDQFSATDAMGCDQVNAPAEVVS